MPKLTGAYLATSILLLGLPLGCETKKHSDQELVGTYKFRDKMIGSHRGPEILILNADGTFFQFYGSIMKHTARCNVGRWERSENSHVWLAGLMRWEEDSSGLGREPTDSIIDFNAPLEDEGSTISLVLNEDIGRRLVKEK